MSAIKRALMLAVAGLLVARCGGDPPISPSPTPPYTGGDAVFVGAGDIALCSDLVPAEATAKLLDATSGTVFTTGDNVQGTGTAEEFRNCYGPTWGRHRDRTRPSPGNHDYVAAGALPYFAYFAPYAGHTGYYSYFLGDWHIISLDSNIAMYPGSPQLEWLATDLNEQRVPCTLAYWHEPLFSSGQNGPNPAVRDIWRLLYAYGVEIVLNGNDHIYERFGLQDPDGRPNPNQGIRQFTVGTGGAPLYQVVGMAPNSEARASVHGVLKLTLRSGAYAWDFIPVAGQSFRDSGGGTCH